MRLTLNIVEHELAVFGKVERAVGDNPSFSNVRCFLAGKSLEQDTLYVCDSADAVAAVQGAGCSALYVDVSPDAEMRSAESSDACQRTEAPAGERQAAPDAPCWDQTAHAALRLRSDRPACAVFDALLDVFERYGRWCQLMDEVRYAGEPLQKLLDVSEPFLQNNVVVLDPALKLIAYTRGIPCDDPITVELIEHGYHTEDNIRKFKLHKRFKPWSEDEGLIVNDTHEICKYVTIVKSFKASSSFSLISVMMCNVVDPAPYLFDVFELFANSMEYYAERDYPDGKPSGNAVDTFLKDLICGAVNTDAIVERSRYVGIPHCAQFCLFYLRPGENSVPSSRLLADVSRTVAPAKTVMVDDAVVVLCFNCHHGACALHCKGRVCPMSHVTISERLNDMLVRYDLMCGRSSKFALLSQTPIAFEQAREAYRIGCGREGGADGFGLSQHWERIASFDACGMDYLAEQLPSRVRDLLSASYAGTVLAAIAEQDALAKSDNYEFLYAYLLYERRTSLVAEQLHMHRNNVSYRIGRIEQQFGIDTADPTLRQDLMMAYRLRLSLVVQNAQLPSID